MRRLAFVLMFVALCLAFTGCSFPLSFDWSRNINTRGSVIRGTTDLGVTAVLNGIEERLDVEFCQGQIVVAAKELLNLLDTEYLSFGAFRNQVLELFPDELVPIGATILSVIESTQLPVDRFGEKNLIYLRAALAQALIAAEAYKWEYRDV